MEDGERPERGRRRRARRGPPAPRRAPATRASAAHRSTAATHSRSTSANAARRGRPHADAQRAGFGADLLERTGAPAARAAYGSPGMAPAITSSTAALSRTERVSTWRTTSPDHDSPSSGPSDTRPRVGLSPNRPHMLAGMRIDPPPSPACAERDHARRPPPRRCRRSSRRGCVRCPTGCASGRTRSARSWGAARTRGSWSCRSTTKPRGLQFRDQVGVVVGGVADLLSSRLPQWYGSPASPPSRSLTTIGTPRNGPPDGSAGGRRPRRAHGRSARG